MTSLTGPGSPAPPFPAKKELPPPVPLLEGGEKRVYDSGLVNIRVPRCKQPESYACYIEAIPFCLVEDQIELLFIAANVPASNAQDSVFNVWVQAFVNVKTVNDVFPHKPQVHYWGDQVEREQDGAKDPYMAV
eukprot:CAMPEP_0197573660 /NCGR_PEP_ID=MMETSP1320-20131121/43079_1 /TAXON_ID=91990 /ORGANISM="Bolidomonas sp., Strain RCC2347" /LENGTH=132 /DNA_ID=CAMNT_0043136175 /DNA_START=80 /DNA_END=479 /DNA_ORIENTATION=-